MPRTDETEPAAQLTPRSPAQSFHAAGRVAARDTTSVPARGFSGGFTWAHRREGDTVELLTPLEQIAARLTVDAAGLQVETSDGKRVVAGDPERYLGEMLGVPLPLAALPSWMQAVPVAGVPFRAEADPHGRPTVLWQAGWRVTYTEYADDSALARPTRMQLSQGGVEARMSISEWSVP